MRSLLPPTLRLPLVLLCVATMTGGCALVTGEPDAPAPAAVPDRIDAAALVDGPTDAAAEARVAELVTEGETRLEAGNAAGALRVAAQIRESYSTTAGSVRALWIESRAHRLEENWSEAERSGGQYLDRAGDDDQFAAAVWLLRAEARFMGDLAQPFEALFQVPEEATESVRDQALQLAREQGSRLDDPVLSDLVNEAPDHGWLLPVFQVEWATRRGLMGDMDRASALAEAALRLNPEAIERDRAERILDGELDARGDVVGSLGIILSLEGSPSVRQLSEQIRDGVEIALLADGIRGGVQLAPREDRGDSGGSRDAAGQLLDSGVLGVVGPLSDAGFRAAADRVQGRVAMISPVAGLTMEASSVFSLAGIDPEGPRALARLIRDLGIESVAIVHSSAADERTEAGWFREAFEAAGGRIHATRAWPEGASLFDDAFRGLMATSPRSVVIFAAPDEVSLIAPLLRSWGLRSMDGPIFGNSAWASESVLAGIQSRHTDGILSVAPHVGSGYGPGWETFVDRYEEHFQRTLRNPVAGLGHDAAALLVEAARLGGNSPEEVLRGLRSIDGLEGATGLFRWQDGRIVRHHYPIRIEDQRRVPVRN